MSFLKKLQNLPLEQRKIIVFTISILAMLIFLIIKLQPKSPEKLRSQAKPRATTGIMEMFLKGYEQEKNENQKIPPIPFFPSATASQPITSPGFQFSPDSELSPQQFEGLPEER